MTMIYATLILFIPQNTVAHAKQDAWLSFLVAFTGGVIISLVVINLSLRFPGQTLFEYLPLILGRFPGKIIGFFYVWLFIHFCALVDREYCSHIVAVFMPETPGEVFLIHGTIMAAYIAYCGLEVLARLNQLFLPLNAGLLTTLFVLVTPEMKVINILPVFDTSLLSLAKSTITPLSWFGEIVALAVIIPYLAEQKNIYHLTIKALFFVLILIELATIGVLLVFSPTLTSSYFFPVLSGTKMINIANFVERLEIIPIVIWVTSGTVKAALFFWAAALGSAQLLGLKDYRPLLLPLAVIVTALGYLLHPSIIDLLNFLTQAFPFYALTFEFIIPFLLLIIVLIKGPGKK
ncbi:MAG TPA: spore gernimation protein [Desulfotomaculum sp.]|nr:spore gernimation protein [Desulfotomaculum sp.]